MQRLGAAKFFSVALTCVFLANNAQVAFGADAKKTVPLYPVRITERGSNEAKMIIQNKGKLTLEAYLRAVDQNFPGLISAEDQRRVASANRLEKQGLFDPLFSTEDGYTRMQNTSKIGDSKRVLFNYPKIELPFRSGIRTFAQYRYNPESAQSPYIETGTRGEYSAGVFVPLLRGFIWNEQSVAEKEAKLGEDLAAQTFFLGRLDTLLRAGATYWNWVGGKRKADVSRQIVHLATALVDMAGQQEKNGDLARIYVTEAEEDVQRRTADLVQSERDFQRFSFRLSALFFDIGGIPLPLPQEENVPDDFPKPQELSESETERHVLLALATRPELKSIDVQKKIATVQLKLAENQLLPAVNVVFTQGYDSGHHGIHNAYRGQVTLSEPLLLRTARGKVAAAKLRLDKLAKDRLAEEQRIRNEILDAISAINMSFAKFRALELQVDKSNQVYMGERERFSAGDSTVFLITQRERQLAEAKMRLIDAEVEYQMGVLALKAITTQL
jgi:outer membrane protein